MNIDGNTKIRSGTKQGYRYVAFSTPANSGFEVTAILYCKNGDIELGDNATLYFEDRGAIFRDWVP